MVFDDNASDNLKRDESEQQKAIDSYSNIDLKSSPPTSADQPKKKEELAASEQLRQNEQDNLRSGDFTEDDHGKKFSSDDDDFFQPPPPKKQKHATMMEAQREILNEDESYEDCMWYDGSTATMDIYDEEFKESKFSAEDEASYEDEFTDYTYDVCNMY